MQDARRDVKGLLTRGALLQGLAASNVLGMVPAEVRSLYDLLLQDNFSPLDMCTRLAPLLAKLPELGGAAAQAGLSAHCPIKVLAYERYLGSLKTSAILRLLRQLSEAYSVMSVSSLAAMVPFATFGEVEAVVVDAVKYDYLQVRQARQARA